jgi:hypothetical protein
VLLLEDCIRSDLGEEASKESLVRYFPSGVVDPFERQLRLDAECSCDEASLLNLPKRPKRQIDELDCSQMIVAEVLDTVDVDAEGEQEWKGRDRREMLPTSKP